MKKLDKLFWDLYELSGLNHPISLINCIEYMEGRNYRDVGIISLKTI